MHRLSPVETVFHSLDIGSISTDGEYFRKTSILLGATAKDQLINEFFFFNNRILVSLESGKRASSAQSRFQKHFRNTYPILFVSTKMPPTQAFHPGLSATNDLFQA